MTWNHFAWVVRLLFWTGFIVGLWFWTSQDNHEKAQTLDDGRRVEFRPNKLAFWGSLVIAAYFAYSTIAYLARHGYGNPFDLLISGCIGLVSLTIMFSLPGTIVVTADGVKQFFWLRKSKQIRWLDIVEINTGEKSRTVTITGADRTKIVHSNHLADRSRLLVELKQRCGENLPSDFPREPISSMSK